MEYNLGKLKKVTDLRSIWKDEARDFTKWLAEEENIKILSDEIGINIVVDETEASSGRYFSDIRAHEEETEKTIIIENQLEATNHDHLGKIVVYSAGLDAEIQIWIVKEARDEHKQAVDWLNEHSDEHINIFLVQIELWQIGDSKIAPKFQIISQPNNWTKALRKDITKNLSNASTIQLNFWQEFRDYCEKNKAKFSLQKAQPHNWYNIAIGSSDARIELYYNTKKNQVTTCLYIAESKELYNKIAKNKDEINDIISNKLQWESKENNKSSKIRLDCDLEVNPEAESWDDAFEWLKTNAELFQKVFKKYI